MKTAIGVYESHEKAVAALQELKKSGYPANQLSVIGKANLVDNHIHVKTNDTAEKVELSIGVVGGAILGVLTGIGVFVMPGLGLLYGAGALVGALGGAEAGTIAGGLVAILTGLGISETVAQRYEKHLNEGKFIVFAQGNDEEIKRAKEVLHTQGYSMELSTN